jgi:hypothetical protein
MIEFDLHYQYEVTEPVVAVLGKESLAVVTGASVHLLDVFAVVRAVYLTA